MSDDNKQNQWVLRIPRSDNANEFVLVHVSSSGKAALDLKFVATEGENPYVGSLRQTRLKNIRSKNFQGTDEELEQILHFVLKANDHDGASSVQRQKRDDIETTASVREAKDGEEDEGNEVVINIRRRIDSITQRIACITLQQEDDQTIELFEWMGLTISGTDILEQRISTLTSQLEAAEHEIQDLKSTLEGLVQDKKEHDSMMLTQFAHILNEKKLKIRNQQRLLAAANIDPERVRELQEAIHKGQAQKSRHNKRKAIHQDKEENIDTDDEFEKMDIDKDKPSRGKSAAAIDEEDEDEDDDEERSETPQPLEEETESEAEEERQCLSSFAATRDREEEEEEEQQQQQYKNQKTTQPSLTTNIAEPPPPKRDLPFLRRSESTSHATDDKLHAEASAGADDAGEATAGETDDDEL